MMDTLVDHPLSLATTRKAYDRSTPIAPKPTSYLSGRFVRIIARCPNAANVRKWANCYPIIRPVRSAPTYILGNAMRKSGFEPDQLATRVVNGDRLEDRVR